jgi:hypothetical protein
MIKKSASKSLLLVTTTILGQPPRDKPVKKMSAVKTIWKARMRYEWRSTNKPLARFSGINCTNQMMTWLFSKYPSGRLIIEFTTIPHHAVTVQIVSIIFQFKAKNVSLHVAMILL